MKARIAVVLGDPADIGPELVAGLLSDEANRSRASVLLAMNPLPLGRAS